DSDLATRNTAKNQATAEVDAKDYEAALTEGRIKPPDGKAAIQHHDAVRKLVQVTDNKTSATLPEEFICEFSDYDRGAFAYRQGPEHWEEARKAWQGLLERPEQDRHYRTVWAAFMLGKMAIKLGDSAAPGWFQKTREFARKGFADSLGLAAD